MKTETSKRKETKTHNIINVRTAALDIGMQYPLSTGCAWAPNSIIRSHAHRKDSAARMRENEMDERPGIEGKCTHALKIKLDFRTR